MNTYTTELTGGTFIVNKADGAMFMSVQAAASSSCTFLGDTPFKEMQPVPFTIGAGQGVSIQAKSTAVPIGGITVTWVSGTINILIGY